MAGIRRDSKGRDRVLVKDQRYQWSMWLGIFLILFCVLFILKAGFDGRFHSVDTLQEYIRSFGLIGPLILIAIQAFQVVIPVLPGFLGCIVGLALLRCRDLFLKGLFFVHHCLELSIEDLVIHVFQHLIQQQCLLGGDVL